MLCKLSNCNDISRDREESSGKSRQLPAEVPRAFRTQLQEIHTEFATRRTDGSGGCWQKRESESNNERIEESPAGTDQSLAGLAG